MKTSFSIISKFYIIALLSLFSSATLIANPVKPGMVEVELISEMTHIKPGETQWFALTQKIEPGWHTYWRNPGDSGAATELAWDLPQGFVAGDIQWPAPEAIVYGPLMNYGYHDQVALLVAISIPEEFTGNSLPIKVTAEWLVCEDMCIPEDAEIELTLAVSTAPLSADSTNEKIFTQARQLVPQDIGVDSFYGISAEKIEFSLSIPGLDNKRIQNIRYFPYGEGLIDNPPIQNFSVTKTGLSLEVTKGYAFDAETAKLAGILVIDETSGEQLTTSFEIHPELQSAISKSSSVTEISLLTAFLYALLGGMILNLMPCVFPVLSIKVLSLVKHQNTSPGEIKMHGFVYLIGVVLSFVTIAAILILLRNGGAQIGWGFQLQSPIVISLLAYLFFVIGLNLAGVFEIGMSMMGVGGSLTQKEGYSGSFFTGVLATVVAAPCTAPFMGVAMGFALTQSSLIALMIFAALGLGMALPYVLLCYSPGLLDKLPKAGNWMERFKELLAFPMYATAVWLVWVLSRQSDSDGTAMVLGGMVLIGFAIWLLKGVSGGGLRRLINRVIGSAIICLALALPFLIDHASSASVQSNSNAAGAVSDNHANYAGPEWKAFSPDLLLQLKQQSPVFVNFTAAWCISCKVNEAVTLNTVAMKEIFTQAGIAYLKGDWTSEDPVITAALAEYGRSGVPLYLLYSQGGDKAEVLPQILTQDIVLDAISRL